jgi:catalase
LQPEFFGRDPSQGPDNIQPQEQNQSNSPSDLDTLFERLSSTPEANRTGLVFFSDHGTPQGWLLNHGYGCHTFKWVNDEGKSVYFKYHFMSKHDQKQFTDGGTLAMGGEDPDYLKPDLWEAIEIGEDIGWIAPVQGTDPNKTDPHIVGSNPFDPTRGWPRRPSHNKNPEYFYRDVDQASVSSESPGFEDFPDSPSLRFPMFFYRDSRNHWIGVCLQQIPDNRPSMAEAFNFDGQVRVDANHAGNKRYARNSFSHKFRPDVSEVPCDANDDFMFR